MTFRHIRVMRSVHYLSTWRNPMARRTDRIESAVALTLLAVLALSFPVATWAAESVYHTTAAHAQSQRVDGRHVKAVLLVNVPPAVGVAGAVSTRWVRARWIAQDGSKRVGEIPAAAGARAGSTQQIWIDRDGRRDPSPPTRASVVAEGVGAGLLIVACAVFVLELTRRAARSALNRARLTNWDAEWRQVGPRWTRPGR